MFNVNIKYDDNAIITELTVDSLFFDTSKYQYAFYLYKNGETIERKFYSNDMSRIFEILNPKGIYHTRVFVKSIDNNSIKGYNSNKLPINIGPYNIEAWNRKVIKVDVENFNSNIKIEDAIYSFRTKDCNNIDVLVENISKISHSKGILVCFTGAITDRKNKAAPFFSGISIAKKLNVTLIAVADSSINLSKELNLAWYAGNKNNTNLPQDIAKILDIFSNILDRRLTLFGGSGGGFAALSISQYLNNQSNVFVWNPQTSISSYLVEPVNRYLEICFNDIKTTDNLYERLETYEVVHDLISSFDKNGSYSSNTLYLQNIGDSFHVDEHAKPLMKVLMAKQVNEFTYTSDNNIVFWLKDWGQGHIVPDLDIILESLERLLNNEDSLEISLSLK